jgi:energy-coupling factor transport system substrate-specific component
VFSFRVTYEEENIMKSNENVMKKSIDLNLKEDFNTMTWVLIPVAIAINVAIGQFVVLLKLPVYLDSIGTVLVGVICGPWAGLLTGMLSNIIWGLAVDPNALIWFPVAGVIGLIAGICANLGLFKTWWKVAVSGFFIALGAVIAGTPISVFLGGITASGSSLITAFLMQTGRSVVASVLSTNFLVEPIDKISTSLLAFAIIQGLSQRFVARFPRPENAQVETGQNRTQLFIAIGAVVVLVLIAIFVLVPLLPK